MTYQKKYWSKNEFLLNGEDFEGYVGIYNKNGYVYETEQLLTKKDSYKTQFNCGKQFFDRVLDNDLELPYSKDQILFQANDFLNKSTLKSIIDRLQANNDYIYKSSTISNTLIPQVDDCLILATEDGLNSYNYQLNDSGDIEIMVNNRFNPAVFSVYFPTENDTAPDGGIFENDSQYDKYTYFPMVLKKSDEYHWIYASTNSYVDPHQNNDDGKYFDSTKIALYRKRLTPNGGEEVTEQQVRQADDATSDIVYQIPYTEVEGEKVYEDAKSYYPGAYRYVPITISANTLVNGVLKKYSLQNKKTTRTALDDTFYDQYHGTLFGYSRMIEGKDPQKHPNKHTYYYPSLFGIKYQQYIHYIQNPNKSSAVKEYDYIGLQKIDDTDKIEKTFSFGGIDYTWNSVLYTDINGNKLDVKSNYTSYYKVDDQGTESYLDDEIDTIPIISLTFSNAKTQCSIYFGGSSGANLKEVSLITNKSLRSDKSYYQYTELKSTDVVLTIEGVEFTRDDISSTDTLVNKIKDEIGDVEVIYHGSKKVTIEYNPSPRRYKLDGKTPIYQYDETTEEYTYLNTSGNYFNVSDVESLYTSGLIQNNKIIDVVQTTISTDSGDKTVYIGKFRTNCYFQEGATPLKQYSSKYAWIPETKRDITESKFNFNNIECTESIITHCGTDEDGDKRIKILIFISFGNKIVILRNVFYPDNFSKNLDNSEAYSGLKSEEEFNNKWKSDSDRYKKSKPFISFNDDSTDIIVLDKINPANNNALEFISVKSIKVYGDYMYVVDQKLNMILRYDISFLKEVEGGSNLWDKKSIRLLDQLQGKGDAKSEIYFNSPVAVDATDDYVYVADQNNNCIKKYSSTMSYERTIKNGVFTSQKIEAIQINPYAFYLSDGTFVDKDSLWIFSTTSSTLYVSIVSNDQVVYSSRIQKINLLEDDYTWNEEFKSVQFSHTNSNYYYICTTKRVYKIHISNPCYPFASLSYFKQRINLSSMVWSMLPYKWHALPCGGVDDSTDVTWNYRPGTTSAEILKNSGFCLCGLDSREYCDKNGTRKEFEGDIIFHIGTLFNQSLIDNYCKKNLCGFDDIPAEELSKMIKTSGIFLYNETDSYISSLSNMNFPAFIKEEIESIKDDEYINSITFNKTIYKVVYNLVNIKNMLIGRFWGYYNLDGLMVYDQLEYDDFFQSMRIKNNDDFFVHDNEQISIVINRIFEKIYNLQLKFIRHLNAKYRAMGAFTNNNFKII